MSCHVPRPLPPHDRPEGTGEFPARFRELAGSAGQHAHDHDCVGVRRVSGLVSRGGVGAGGARVRSEHHAQRDGLVRYRRLYVSRAVDVELDKTGRLLVPQELRAHSGLEHDVLWVGSLTKVELWAKANWERYLPKRRSSTKNSSAAFRSGINNDGGGFCYDPGVSTQSSRNRTAR